MEILYLFVSLLFGFGAGWLIRQYKSSAEYEMSPDEARNFRQQSQELAQTNHVQNERINLLQEEKKNLESKLEASVSESRQLGMQTARLEAELKNLKDKLDHQKDELIAQHQRMTEQFKNLANEILEEKSKKFTDQNKVQIDQILQPLGLKIKEFEKKVQETYDIEARDKSGLKVQINQLLELNKKMSEEANNLTKALKGDSKTQGNWGEVVLERILERSGLTKGQEYQTQFSIKNEEGSRLQPDVVIHLPDEKYLVIDAKVTLTAYERFVSSTDAAEQEVFLKQHIQSIKAHVKDLSAKQYDRLFEKSPDFVLMFIPIEPAFGLAVMNDSTVYNEAFDKNIVIVSPSTLLATMATIKNIWKYEYQSQNAQKIADEGTKLYDKFVSFVEDLEKVGDQIGKVQQSHEAAMNKLSIGRGNLIGRAEKMKSLGLSTRKKISPALLQDPEEDRDYTEEFK